MIVVQSQITGQRKHAHQHCHPCPPLEVSQGEREHRPIQAAPGGSDSLARGDWEQVQLEPLVQICIVSIVCICIYIYISIYLYIYIYLCMYVSCDMMLRYIVLCDVLFWYMKFIRLYVAQVCHVM